MRIAIGSSIGGQTVSAGAGGGGEPVLPGFDVFVLAGQSNMFAGSGYDADLDPTSDLIRQMLNHPTPGAASDPAPVEPYDWPIDIVPGCIGPGQHFATDWYIPNDLRDPRTVLMLPEAKGGTSVGNSGEWGAVGGTLTETVTADDSWMDLTIQRVRDSNSLEGENRVVAVLWHQGEGDYQVYGNGFAGRPMTQFRWKLMRAMLHFRQQIDDRVPIVMGRMSKWSIDAAGERFAVNGVIIDAGIMAMAHRLPFLAIADSQSPTELGLDDVHFTAAEQRVMAGRFYGAWVTAKSRHLDSPTTWDHVDYLAPGRGAGSTFLLSNGNLDVSGNDGETNDWKTMISTNPRFTGRKYVEFEAVSYDSFNLGFFGVCNIEHGLTSLLGGEGDGSGPTAMSAGFWPHFGTSAATDPGLTRSTDTMSVIGAPGEVYGMVVDCDEGKVYASHENVWVGNPATGESPWISGWNPGEGFFPAVSVFGGTANKWRIRPSAAAQKYAAPDGCEPWDA
jgi:hypothetical protein